ncbi:MAG TPA: beta-ketoacyl synthase N-terminal-like domain-containing protein [Planctomycetota bacterium]|nr:beta-ketoacyl synthase N-terminal-like domain-containing protein [Planctomycetota bacterium]
MSASSFSRAPGLALAITGLGCVGAPGAGLAAQRAALASGACGLRVLPQSRVPIARSVPVGAVDVALPRLASRTPALALCAALEALRQANLPKHTRGEIAVVVGTCTGGMPESEAVFLAEGDPVVSDVYRRQHPHRTTQALARLTGCHGPQGTHALACASAAAAIIEAMELVRSGACPAALAVGADALTRVTTAGFTSLMLVDPHGCRPLTAERGGMSLGEGAAALLIEHPEHARRRGARPLASLLGWGEHPDAHHLTAPEPGGVQLERAINDALADAGVERGAIGYVNAHGTGTRDNDQVEISTLARLFGAIPTASAKRTYGHTMGAAAAVEAVACCLAVGDQRLWASAGAAEGTAMPGVEVVRQTRFSVLDVVLSTTLAFGGVNACLAFGKGERCA